MKNADSSVQSKVQSNSNKKSSCRSNNEGCSADTRRLAKISRPKICSTYLRAELFQKLQKPRKQRWFWLSALAGAGKNTLIADYVASHGLDCNWYQIDTGDADPATYYSYLGLAIHNLASQQHSHLPNFIPEYQQNHSPIMVKNDHAVFCKRIVSNQVQKRSEYK